MRWGYPETGKVALFCGDAALALVAIIASLRMFHPVQVSFEREVFGAFAFTLIFLSFHYIFDLYQVTGNGQTAIIYRYLAACCADTLVSSAFFFIIYPMAAYTRRNVIVAVLLACAASYVLRCIYRVNPEMFVNRRPVLIVGTAEDAWALSMVLRPNDPRYELIGYFGEAAQYDRSSGAIGGPALAASAASLNNDRARRGTCKVALVPDEGCLHLGPAEPAAVKATLSKCDVGILLANSKVVSAELASLLTTFRFSGGRLYSVLDFYRRLSEELPLELLTHDWLSFAEGFDFLQSRISRRLKRLTDLLLATVGLLLASPLMLAAAIAIKLDSPGPILFRQTRVGWKGIPYRLLKFRSMREDAEVN